MDNPIIVPAENHAYLLEIYDRLPEAMTYFLQQHLAELRAAIPTWIRRDEFTGVDGIYWVMYCPSAEVFTYLDKGQYIAATQSWLDPDTQRSVTDSVEAVLLSKVPYYQNKSGEPSSDY
jgi:hypothetical protein